MMRSTLTAAMPTRGAIGVDLMTAWRENHAARRCGVRAG